MKITATVASITIILMLPSGNDTQNKIKITWSAPSFFYLLEFTLKEHNSKENI